MSDTDEDKEEALAEMERGSGAGMEEIVRLLRCQVCHSMMKDPSTLLCGHTFCTDCLRSVYEEKSQMECPTCRQVTDREPEQLTKSITVSDMLEKLDIRRYQFTMSCNIIENAPTIDELESLKRECEEKATAATAIEQKLTSLLTSIRELLDSAECQLRKKVSAWGKRVERLREWAEETLSLRQTAQQLVVEDIREESSMRLLRLPKRRPESLSKAPIFLENLADLLRSNLTLLLSQLKGILVDLSEAKQSDTSALEEQQQVLLDVEEQLQAMLDPQAGREKAEQKSLNRHRVLPPITTGSND